NTPARRSTPPGRFSRWRRSSSRETARSNSSHRSRWRRAMAISSRAAVSSPGSPARTQAAAACSKAESDARGSSAATARSPSSNQRAAASRASMGTSPAGGGPLRSSHRVATREAGKDKGGRAAVLESRAPSRRGWSLFEGEGSMRGTLSGFPPWPRHRFSKGRASGPGEGRFPLHARSVKCFFVFLSREDKRRHQRIRRSHDSMTRPPLPPLAVALAHLRSIASWSREELGHGHGLASKTIAEFEAGHRTLSRARAEQLVATLGFGPEMLDEVLADVERRRGEVSPEGSIPLPPAERRALARSQRDLSAYLAAELGRLRRLERAREERAAAGALFERLAGFTSIQRCRAVEGAEKYLSWALALRLAEESAKAAPDSAARAL